MNEYEVTLTLTCTYRVAAVNEEMAIDQAMEWFSEASPEVDVEKVYDAATDKDLKVEGEV
jgi:hypothetical protein